MVRDRAELGRAAGQFGGPTVSNPNRWVGIDLHRRRSQVAIIDEQGELTLSRRVVNDRDAFRELLGDPDATHVALEATYGWEWLAELREDAGYDVHFAHPLRTRAIAIARVKTDAVDAKTLAHLLRTGLLPEAYIAPPELRDLLHHRAVPHWVMKTSLLKTLAGKHDSSVSKMARKYGATIETPHGPHKCLQATVHRSGRKALVATFGGLPLRRRKTAVLTDRDPTRERARGSELIRRLVAGRCELCGQTEKVQIHQIRDLADLDQPGQPQPEWMQVMARRRRKTLVVCDACHASIHDRKPTASTRIVAGAPGEPKGSRRV
jgi:hypothetical protein